MPHTACINISFPPFLWNSHFFLCIHHAWMLNYCLPFIVSVLRNANQVSWLICWSLPLFRDWCIEGVCVLHLLHDSSEGIFSFVQLGVLVRLLKYCRSPTNSRVLSYPNLFFCVVSRFCAFVPHSCIAVEFTVEVKTRERQQSSMSQRGASLISLIVVYILPSSSMIAHFATGGVSLSSHRSM